jgi:hypothetical protein
MKIKGTNEGPHKWWNMWFNSMQNKEPHKRFLKALRINVGYWCNSSYINIFFRCNWIFLALGSNGYWASLSKDFYNQLYGRFQIVIKHFWGSWDFIFLKMGKIFGIRKKFVYIFLIWFFFPSLFFNNSYIKVRLIGVTSNVLIFF